MECVSERFHVKTREILLTCSTRCS
jgi:hypothetical protein